MPNDFASPLDSSAPPDADPNGFTADNGGEAPDQKDFEDKIWFPADMVDGERTLLDFAKKRKARHLAWFGDNNGYNEKILDWWKSYDGKLLAGQTAPNSIPISHSVVETDYAKSYQALTTRDKVVDGLPQTPQVNNENKQTVDDLINQEILWSPARTGEKLFGTLKALKIEGTGVGRLSWEKRCIETISVPTQMDLMKGKNVAVQTVAEAKTYRVTHGPNWTPTPVQNMIWDSRVDRLQDSRYIAERLFPNITELLLMEQEGKITNVDAIMKLPSSREIEKKNPDQKRKQLLAPSGNGPMEQGAADEQSDERELDEWFAWVPYQAVDEDGGKHWTEAPLHFMIVNDEVLIMCERNPWVDAAGYGLGHPYFGFHQSIVPRSFLGRAVHAPIQDLQIYVNNLAASTQKLVNKAARNPTFVSRAAGLDSLRLFTDELAVIPVNDAKEISHHPIDAGAIDAASKERGWAINLARETVAANEQIQGVPTSVMGNATATEASIINANSGMRFQVIVDQLYYEFFAAMANGFYWMFRQWLLDEDEVVVRESTIDGSPRLVTRADLVDDYYFVPITAAVQNDERATLQVQMQIAQQVQQLQQTNPAAMVDETGRMYHFDLFDFLVHEIFPKVGMRNGRTYFKEVPQGGMALPLAAQVGPGLPPLPGQPGSQVPAPQIGSPQGHGAPGPMNRGIPMNTPRGPGAPNGTPGPQVPVAPGLPFGPQTPVRP